MQLKYKETKFEEAVLGLLNHLKEGGDFEKECKILSFMYGNFEYYELEDYFLSEGFVSTTVTSANWLIASQKLTVAQLKDVLRDAGLKISGKKQELIDRISENIDLSKVSIKNEYGNDYYIITQKGLDYLEENRHLFNYYRYLKFDYRLSEFLEYHDENYENYKDSLEEVFNFIKMKEEQAIKENNPQQYLKVLSSKRRIYDLEELNDEKSTNNQIYDELKIYCLNLNNKGKFKDYKLNTNNIKYLRNFYKEIKFDYETLISEIYKDSFYEKEYSLEETIHILKEAVNGTTMINLNNKLKEVDNNGKVKKYGNKSLDDYL